MARQWRIEYEGALYHVMSRGNEGRSIAEDDEDRTLFLQLLGEMSERFEIEVHSWVLMSNHYHLLLKTRRANQSKGMQWFGATYTRRYNIKHKRRGHLFQGRFKSLLVENDNYLFRLSCYIHRNPLRAKIVKRLGQYDWSSYRVFAYAEPKPAWLVTELILSQLNDDDRHKAYRKKVQRYSGEEKKISEEIHLGIVSGTKKFARFIKNKYMPENPSEEIPQQKHGKDDYDIAELLSKAAEILSCDIDTYKIVRRIDPDNKLKRNLLVYLLWKTGAFTNKEIGVHFGLGYSAVSRCVSVSNEMVNNNKAFKEGYNKIKSLIKM
ncbi:toxin RelE [Candidatus Magnetomorum sp. HK-1]|nr:toxin RelE [Candidatus Magnetomorum sp. HK-1]